MRDRRSIVEAKFKIKEKEKNEDADAKKILRWITEGADHCEADHTRVEETMATWPGQQWSKGRPRAAEEPRAPAMPLNKIMPVLKCHCQPRDHESLRPEGIPAFDDDASWAEVANDLRGLAA